MGSDLITQEELRQASEAGQVVRQIQKRLRGALRYLRRRLRQGARVEAGRYRLVRGRVRG